MNLKWDPSLNSNQIRVPDTFASGPNPLPRRIVLQLGAWRREMELLTDGGLQENHLALPPGLFEPYTIPEQLPYDVRLTGRTLQLGPVIAFMPFARVARLHERLEHLLEYMQGYSQFGGLLYICAADHIRPGSGAIEGLAYRPDGPWGKASWVPGLFPYPDALYRRTDYRQPVADELSQQLGDRVFNGYFFNKWEMWKVLSESPALRGHLPETERFSSVDQVIRMAERHGSAYFKRVNGLKAQGIAAIAMKEEGFLVSTRRGKGQLTGNREQLERLLLEMKENYRYLVQQAINVKRHEGRSFDFRVLMQKDGSKQWSCPGIVGRFGKPNNIVTNFLAHGYSMTGTETLKTAFGYNEREAFQKEQEMIRLAVEACNYLEQTVGHYADLGFDMMLDTDGKPWILEINKLHDHKMPLYGLEDPQMYYKVLTNPFLYARALAGYESLQRR